MTEIRASASIVPRMNSALVSQPDLHRHEVVTHRNMPRTHRELPPTHRNKLSCSPRELPGPRRDTLVMLSDIYHTLEAGYGSSTLTARTLDAVSLQICEGELLIVRGHSSHDALALKMALFEPIRTVRGDRWTAADVVVRCASIHSRYCETVEGAWSACSISESALARYVNGRKRIVYLLTESEVPASYTLATERKCWEWSVAFRNRGGAVVMFESRRQRAASAVTARRVREPGGSLEGSGVRRFRFAAGRLFEVHDEPLHSVSETPVGSPAAIGFAYARTSPDSE